MTSVQAKKEAVSEADRQKILKQMKVRTTLKKDKSWIHQQSSEEEKDDNPGPLSPQLRSLESRKSIWSTSPDTKAERNSGTFTATEIITSSPSPTVQSSNRNSGTFTAKEIVTSSPSPTVQSSNKQFSYTSTDSSKPTTSQPSPPPSTSGYKPSTSYIIRGQPVNAVSQVKSPPSFNGYQNSTVQLRSASLPRGNSLIGSKISTEDYKKLAPYNLRNKSVDMSDDENPFSPQDQEKRTLQASGILRSTSSKDRSYVISAAKRNSGIGTHDAPLPFRAKRVEIPEEENNANKKSQTLPKTLSSYLHEDVSNYEKYWKENQNKQTSPQMSPIRTTDRSGSPVMTTYSTSNSSSNSSSSVTPESAKITVVNKESNNKAEPKPATENQTTPTRTATTRTERPTDRSGSPVMTSYSTSSSSTRSSSVTPEPSKITIINKESDKKEEPKPATEKETTTTRTVPTRPERFAAPEKKCDSLSNSLASYLYNDVNRFEKNWQGNQSQTPATQTSPPREINRPESPKVTSRNTHIDTGSSAVKPEPGKITVLREESDKSVPNTTSTRTVTTRTERTIDRPESPNVTSWNTNIETGSSTIKPEPGKITVLREESDKSVPRSSSSRTVTTRTESGNSNDTETKVTQTGPGKITVVRDESNNQPDLISWSDLSSKSSASDNRVEKEKSPSPSPAPRISSKNSEKSLQDPPLTVISPELNTNRPSQKTAAFTTANEARYRVPESLDEPEIHVNNDQVISSSENRGVQRTETNSSRTLEGSSSPRPTPRARETTSYTTVPESRYRVPEVLEDTMPESSPARSNSRTTVTTTRSTDPIYTEYLEEADTRSARTISSSREKTTTTTTVETRYDNSSSGQSSQQDPHSSNKGVLFVKEYVNTSENMKSPTSAGSFPDFSNDSENVSYSSSSSYLYSSSPKRSDEGPCTYCGREIKDCAKIILEHLNIYCHEYCFKCGICGKAMGDLIDSLFIHRDVVHCESCYEKLF